MLQIWSKNESSRSHIILKKYEIMLKINNFEQKYGSMELMGT